MHKAWLLLGSNVHPEINLPKAVRMISAKARVLTISSVWKSPPADRSDQPEYWNAALLIETDLMPGEIRNRIVAPAEDSLGRKRTADRYAPRTIDIDLMLYDSFCGWYDEKPLPHPDILRRAFAAVPLAEISPDYLHPAVGKTLREIAAQLPDLDSVRKQNVTLIP